MVSSKNRSHVEDIHGHPGGGGQSPYPTPPTSKPGWALGIITQIHALNNVTTLESPPIPKVAAVLSTYLSDIADIDKEYYDTVSKAEARYLERMNTTENKLIKTILDINAAPPTD